MTMTHKEALYRAIHAWFGEDVPGYIPSSAMADYHIDMEAAIRAYIEARGLVLVLREPTGEMQDAIWLAAQLQNADAQYRAMLAAAPDPFAQEERA